MHEDSLHDFYKYAVLPQFGIKNVPIIWQGSHDTGPDETAHYFKLKEQDYVLIFEDYDGNGRNDAYIKDNVLEYSSLYEFIKPTSQTSNSPSYNGFKLPAPSMYCSGVTGTFTLIKLLP